MRIFKKIRMESRKRIYGVTWTCPRCGKVFLTEGQYAVHILLCGPK